METETQRATERQTDTERERERERETDRQTENKFRGKKCVFFSYHRGFNIERDSLRQEVASILKETV